LNQFLRTVIEHHGQRAEANAELALRLIAQHRELRRCQR
jgi:hypothetical protein